MSQSLAELVEPYGAPAESVIDFRGALDARHVDYLDLVGQSRSNKRKRLPDGVVQLRNESIAYLVDGREQRPEPNEISHLRRIASFRDDAPYLVVIEPGKLSVYGVALDGLAPEQAYRGEVARDQPEARSTFHRLQTQPDQFSWAPERQQAIETLIFERMTAAVDGLLGFGVSRDDAISLAGRALFTRFLLDRGIIKDAWRKEVCKGAKRWEEVFSTPQHVRSTSVWLDRTFNGDFLPVSLLAQPNTLEVLPSRSFDVLTEIMRGSGGQTQLGLSWTETWHDLDFAHIPVGVLSQVYEHQAKRWEPARRQATGLYYTPRRIAEYMVKESFALLRERSEAELHETRVLDPAVGGGVFLVAALRELAAAWWRNHGYPPSSRELRQILYRQIAGFDIREPALRLTSLSLYLAVIELDRNPTRISDLRFSRPLREQVLFLVREPGIPDDGAVAGSLGRMVGSEHKHAYDLVIGNPPWTSLPSSAPNARQAQAEIRSTILPIVEERLGHERAQSFELTDNVPDLPFMWRAMEWAKPDACIAFALHGRLLFKGTDVGARARADLFDALEIVGVLNGAALRLTNVWPEVTSPFCLVFARNCVPSAQSTFYFISPHEERALNEQGRLRIDATAAHPVSPVRLRERPELLKTLFRGTPLDVDVLERIRMLPSFENWWQRANGRDQTGGQGYRIGRQEQSDALFLLGKPNLTTNQPIGYVIDTRALPRFAEQRLNRPRHEAIYRAPLLLIKQSPPIDRDRARASISYEDLAYSESFYGYSAHGHRDATGLVQYGSLLIHSELFLWHVLMTSSKFGVEREALLKENIDSFPVVPLDTLAPAHTREIAPLFAAMQAKEHPWRELDSWIQSIYGLTRWDQEVIRDTLATSLPFAAVKERAQRPPDAREVDAFAQRLQQELLPFVPKVQVRCVESDWAEASPWWMMLIEPNASGRRNALSNKLISQFMNQADELGASQFILVDTDSARLLVGILRQRRYFTQSRARLCSLELIDQHLTVLLDLARNKHAS